LPVESALQNFIKITNCSDRLFTEMSFEKECKACKQFKLDHIVAAYKKIDLNKLMPSSIDKIVTKKLPTY